MDKCYWCETECRDCLEVDNYFYCSDSCLNEHNESESAYMIDFRARENREENQ
jgi:hypothetical protein